MPEGFSNKPKQRRMAGAPVDDDGEWVDSGKWELNPYVKGFESRVGPLGYQELRALSPEAWERIGGPPSVLGMMFPEQVFYRDKKESEDPASQHHEAIHIGQERGLTLPGEPKAEYRMREYQDPFMQGLSKERDKQREYYEAPAYEFEVQDKPGNKRERQRNRLKAYLDELRWLNPEPHAATGLATFESAVDPAVMRDYLKTRPLPPMRPHPRMMAADIAGLPWWEKLFSR